MGSIRSALECSDRMRPLLAMGLNFLLAEPGSPLYNFRMNLEESSPDSPDSVAVSSVSPSIFEQLNKKDKTEEAMPPSSPSCYNAPENVQPQKNELSSPAENFSQPVSRSEEAHPTQKNEEISLISWPSPWDKLAEKVRNTFHNPVWWTYWELGLDMLKKGSEQERESRKSAINEIMDKLNLGAGLNHFWPMSLPDEAGVVPDMENFLRGLDQFKPQFLLVFGEKALKVIEKIIKDDGVVDSDICVYKAKSVHGCLLLPLPDLQEAVKPEHIGKTVEFLLDPYLKSLK